MCLVPLPADTASVDNPSTRTITLPGPSFLDSTTMKISIFRIPGCAHLTFQAIDVFGFDDSSPRRKTLRARRIFCSNRNARPSCGRTFSAWCADKIRRLSLTTHAVCQFLQRAAAHSVAAAVRAADCLRSDRTGQRLWKRFDLGQSKIRTALAARCPPPQPPTPPARRPAAAQVLAHLQAAFPDAHCPIAAFQQTLRTFFV